MDKLIDERIGEPRKIFGIQILSALSFASFAVFAVILVVMAIFAITDTGLEEVWFIVMLVSIISSGVFLIPAIVVALLKESNKQIANTLIITVPLIAAIIPVIFLFVSLNDASITFKDHFALASVYPHFKEDMWGWINHLLDSSIWVILATVALTIIKIAQNRIKKSLPLIFTSVVGILGVLPVQISGIVISRTEANYEAGIRMFWWGVIIFAIISLVSYYYILQEIETVSLKKISEKEQIQENNAKITMIMGAVSIIISILWFIATTSNDDLISYFWLNMPRPAFPSLALYGFGTAIITYSLLKWQKTRKNQLFWVYLAVLSIAVIIPAKIFSIYYVWYWGSKNNLISAVWGWDNETKPFTLVLTDLLPMAVFLFCTSFLVWQKKNNKRKNSWLLILPLLALTASMVFLSVIIWFFWGTVTYDLNNFYYLFTASSIIVMVELVFLITIISLELLVKREVKVEEG